LLAGLAPALAGGTPQAAQQAQNSPFGFLFPTPDGSASPPAPASPPGQAVFNSDGTVQANNQNGYPDGSG